MSAGVMRERGDAQEPDPVRFLPPAHVPVPHLAEHNQHNEQSALLQDLAVLAAQLCDAPIAVAGMLTDPSSWTVASQGLGDCLTAHQAQLCQYVIDGGTAVIVHDLSADHRFAQLPWASEEPRPRFYAGVTIFDSAGAVMGSLCVADTVTRTMPASQLSALGSLARQAGLALQLPARTTELARMTQQDEAILNTSRTCVLLLRGTEILQASPSAVLMLGAGHAEALLHSDLSEHAWDDVLEVPGPGSFATEIVYWRLRRGDGSPMVAEVSVTPIESADPGVCQVELRDVSYAVEDFVTLTASERLYRTLTHNSTDLITLQSDGGAWEFVSPGSLGLTGYTPEEMARLAPLELIHPEDLAGVLESHIDARRSGIDHFTVSYRMLHREGEWIPVESSVQLLHDEAGAVTGFQTTTRDIVERVLVEQGRDQADRRFRVAMDNAPIGMGLMSLDGRLTEVNRSLCELFDQTEFDLVGSKLFSLAHPDHVYELGRLLPRLVSGSRESISVETRLERSPGEYLWVLCTASVVRLADGTPSYVVLQIQDFTAWKQAEDRLARQALRDPLTGLANRLMMTQRLSHALVTARRRGTCIGIIFLDLDRFKSINDSLGHNGGDAVLCEVALRLEECIREQDTAVRLGGDEFVVLCEDLAGGMPDLQIVAGRIEAALRPVFLIEDRAIHVSASMGLSIAGARDDDADTALRHSDAAMYLAKQQGRGRTEIYDGTLRAELDVLSIAEELRSGLADEQLRVFYQPVVSMADGAICAHEALVRWQHPDRGLLPPGEFLRAAEDSPLICRLGEWVLERACRDTVALPERMSVTVNVSPRQLAEPDFAQRVHGILDRTGLDPRLLILEITETSILQATAAVVACAEAITALGVRLALDDFGTGQSSLSSLQRLPISVLKIDRSFTSQIGRSPSTERLIVGVLQLGFSTGLQVVAEGVEHFHQAQFLLRHGCTMAQGYLYGHPLPKTRVGPLPTAS